MADAMIYFYMGCILGAVVGGFTAALLAMTVGASRNRTVEPSKFRDQVHDQGEYVDVPDYLKGEYVNVPDYLKRQAE